MTIALCRLLDALGHVASTADLRSLGHGPAQVEAMVRSGFLVRLRRGAFVDGEVWRAARSWERHVLRARAVHRSLGPDAPVAWSHQSGLVMQQVGVHAVDNRAHMCRTDGGRSRADNVLVKHLAVPDRYLVDLEHGRSVSVPLACVQVACCFGVEAGLVSTDAALREGKASPAELEEALGVTAGTAGHPAAARVVELASPLSESAGESRTAWLLLTLGLVGAEQQVEIADASGMLVARVDFLFRERRVIVEFDGMLKYDDPAALRKEKLREDRLRELGYEVVRLTWADLADPALVERRVRAAFARAQAKARR